MSLTALKSAFQHISDVPLTPCAKLVLLCLANRHNQETGRCDPSIERMMCDLKISERAVRSALRELEAAKLISTVHRVSRTGRGKRNLTNRYRIRGGAKSAGGMGQNLPPKQEDKPAAFDDLIFSVRTDYE